MSTKILIPINHSDYSQAIIPHVETLFTVQNTELRLFFVTRPARGMGFASPDPDSNYALEAGGEPVGPKTHPIYAEQQEASSEAHIIAELLPLTNRLQEAGYDLSLQVCFNEHVIDEIARVAQHDNIDLIAMSTRARDKVRGFFFTDVANLVIRRVDIPVLLFQPTV